MKLLHAIDPEKEITRFTGTFVSINGEMLFFFYFPRRDGDKISCNVCRQPITPYGTHYACFTGLDFICECSECYNEDLNHAFAEHSGVYSNDDDYEDYRCINCMDGLCPTNPEL